MSRSGIIYILISPARVGLLKIGKSTRAAQERANELSKETGVPARFEVALQLQVSDRDEADRRVHEALEDRRENKEREFFRVPLEVAIRTVYRVCNDLLIKSEMDDSERGQDLEDELSDAASASGIHALSQAILREEYGTAEILLEEGADANERSSGGVTPLMLAVALNWTEMVALLLRHGADPTAETETGESVEQIAKQRGGAFLRETIQSAVKNYSPPRKSALENLLSTWRANTTQGIAPMQ